MMRTADFLLRLAFFATMPFLATFASAAFPMTGVLVNIALALVVFALAEVVRPRVGRSRVLAFLVKRQLAFEAYYREHPTGPFLYYVLSPLLFPYWLLRRKARREVLVYGDLTFGGVVILVASGALEFFRSWQPQLGVAAFLRIWGLLLVAQIGCTLLFLAPIATTVVRFHLERRRAALWFLLAVGALSVSLAVASLVRRKAPVVSWATTERVTLRAQVDPEVARAVEIEALRQVWAHPDELRSSTDKRGWVEDDALARAEDILEAYYQPDEAYAFTLHAAPPEAPEVLLLQCHLGWGRRPLWRAIRRSGEEITSRDELPPGLLGLRRRATRRPPTHPAPFQRSAK